jgi:hypothetical protein
MVIHPVFGRTQNKNYNQLLTKYVTQQGRVDYQRLCGQNKLLTDIKIHFQTLSEQDYHKLKRQDQLAFLLNAYNFFIIERVCGQYPLQSIKDIQDVFEAKTLSLFKRSISFNELENDLIRKVFKEPRIHFALVCAAISCPALRKEPYEGAKLEQQLTQQTRLFLAQAEHFTLQIDSKTMRISQLFNWFSVDFTNSKETASLDIARFIATYTDQTTAVLLKKHLWEVEYSPYDWQLNHP